MKTIVKRKEPASLTEYRAKPHSSYAGLRKEDVRNSLIAEQGHICCYCMRRIPESGKTPGVKIEHFHCQKDHSDEELDYKNMLVACLGNEGSPKHLQTCDTKKGNISLTYSPSNKVIEGLLKYKANGEIYSSDKTFNSELEKVLNLNEKRLKDNRRIVYEKVQKEIRTEGKRHQNKVLRKEFLESKRKKWANPNDGKYIEYCMVGVYLIDKKLRKIMNSKLK